MKIPRSRRREKADPRSFVPGSAAGARDSIRTRRLPLVYAFAVLGMLWIPAPSQAGEWILDQSGCKLWNPKPLPGETIIWSGACEDGYAEGEGVAQWFVDGVPASSYTGSVRAGKSHGRGSAKYRNGNAYEGNFVDGRFDGKGIFIWADGERYEGDYVGGVRTGKGLYAWTNGNRYEGNFADGKRTGKGVFAWADGDRYEGDFVDGVRTGSGVYTWPDGERFEGEYVNDKRHDGRQFGSDGRLVASYSGGRRTEHAASTGSSGSEFLSVLGAVAQGLAVAAGNRNAAGLNAHGRAPTGSVAGLPDPGRMSGGAARQTASRAASPAAPEASAQHCISFDHSRTRSLQTLAINACDRMVWVKWFDQDACRSGCANQVSASARSVMTSPKGRYEWAACFYPATPRDADGSSAWRSGPYQCRR